MRFVKQLKVWRDLHKHIKTENKGAEFMDNIEWQKTLSDMDVKIASHCNTTLAKHQ